MFSISVTVVCSKVSDDSLTYRCKQTGHTPSNCTENIDRFIPLNKNQIETPEANENQNTTKNPNQEENPEITYRQETHLINLTNNRDTVHTDTSISEAT